MSFNALQSLQAFGMGQQAAMQRRAVERQEQEYDNRLRLNEGLAGAYDVQTGQLDPTRARQAYIAAGDVPGAMQMDQAQGASRQAALERARAEVQVIARLAQGVTDQASYSQALASAQRYGFDTSTFPQEFTPAFIAQIQNEARALQGQIDEQLTPFQRELRAAGINPGSADYEQIVRERYAPTKWIPVPEGGYLQGIAPGGQPIGTDGNNLPRISSPEQARSLPPGTEFMTPDGRRLRVPGGPTPSASGGF